MLSVEVIEYLKNDDLKYRIGTVAVAVAVIS